MSYKEKILETMKMLSEETVEDMLNLGEEISIAVDENISIQISIDRYIE